MSSRNPTKLLLFILLLCVGVFPALLRPVERQQELRVLIVARNMLQSGDWLHPRFQNQPRYRKPPLAYWTAAAAMGLTGQHDSPVPARLVTLLALAGVACFVLRLAAKANVPTVPCLTLLLACYGVWNFAPHAETDVWLLLGVTGSIWAWLGGRGFLAGGFMALGVLAKGPAAVAIPLLSFVFLGRRPWKQWGMAVLPPLLCGGAWVAFLASDPLAQESLQKELQATFVETAHPGSPLYYLYTLPKLLLPGVLLLPFLRIRQIPYDARVWFLVTFFLLSVTSSKQAHYALLLLPPAALCMAGGLFHKTANWPWNRIAVVLAILFIAIECVSLQQDATLENQKFLRKARAQIAPGATLHVVGVNSAIFDWNLGRHVENTDDPDLAWRRAKSGDAVLEIRKTNAGWTRQLRIK